MSDVFETIKKNVSIEQEIQDSGTTLDSNGMGKCPFHEDNNNSFGVYDTKMGHKEFKCFACVDMKGSVIDYVMLKNNYTLRESVNYISKKYGIENDGSSFVPNTKEKPGVDFTKKQNELRMNLRDKVKSEGVDFLKRVFPLISQKDSSILNLIGWDTENESIAILVDRVNIKTEKKNGFDGKWISEKGGIGAYPFPVNVYNKMQQDQVIVCEGEKDAINLILNGKKAITMGSAGASWLPYRELVENQKEVIILYDNDPAGVDGANKFAREINVKNRCINLGAIKKKDAEDPIPNGYDASDALKEFPFKKIVCADTTAWKNSKSKDKKLKFDDKPLLDELGARGRECYFDLSKKCYTFKNKKSKKLDLMDKTSFTQVLSSLIERNVERDEFDQIPLKRSFFNPTKPEEYFENGETLINEYLPNELMGKNKIDGQEIELPKNTLQLYENVFSDGLEMDVFLNWLACFYQTGKKSLVAYVIVGKQGVGKGLIFEQIKEIWGSQYCSEVSNDNVEDRYDDWMIDKLWINLDEVSTDYSSRKRVKNKIKRLVTASENVVKPKVIRGFTRESHFNIYITSNEAVPLDVELDDRRFNIISSDSENLNKKPYFDDGDFAVRVREEAPEMAQYLANYPADFSRYNKVFQTKHKTFIQHQGLSPTEQFCIALRDSNLDFFKEFLNPEGESDHNSDEILNILEASFKDGFVKSADYFKIYILIFGDKKVTHLHSCTAALKRTGVFKEENFKVKKVDAKACRGLMLFENDIKEEIPF